MRNDRGGKTAIHRMEDKERYRGRTLGDTYQYSATNAYLAITPLYSPPIVISAATVWEMIVLSYID